MAYARSSISNFELANALYIGASVAFYTVDVNGAKTTTFATLYADTIGSTLLPNPQVLDSLGKFAQPVYIQDPVIATVSGGQNLLPEQDTGIITNQGRVRGPYVAGTTYYANDLVQDPATGIVYSADSTYVAISVANDITTGRLVLFLQPADLLAVQSAQAAALAAANSQTAAAAAAASAQTYAANSLASQTAAASSAGNSATSATSALASSTSALSSANLAQNTSKGFVNRFRNPLFSVAQRGTSGTINGGTSGYTVDGWILGATGANLAWQQGGAGTVLTMTGNTSMSDTFLKQRIESLDAYNLVDGSSVTVQFSIFNGSGAALIPTLTVKHATAADNWAATITDVNAVALQSIPNNTTQTVAYTFTPNLGGQNGLEITLDFGAALNANTKSAYVNFADIRKTSGLSAGLNNSPPVLEARPMATEFSYCQRYYTLLEGNGLQGQVPSTTSVILSGRYPVQMRAPPTLTLIKTSFVAASFEIFTGATWVDGSGCAITSNSGTGAGYVVQINGFTSLTPGVPVLLSCGTVMTASAEL